MLDYASLISAIFERRNRVSPKHALLVAISGIDASGKGFVASQIAQRLSHPAGRGEGGCYVALIGVDGWLNLPHVRFCEGESAAHFYNNAFRFDEMFERLIEPLRNNRSIELDADYTEETATAYRKHRYDFHDIDVILLEGIFLLKRAHRHHFDLTSWIDCSFETALERAIKRGQEGLPRNETIRAFETIYFPAQRIHFERDNPESVADVIVRNGDL